MVRASEIHFIIKDGRFIDTIFNKDVDWDAELDARDAAEFDEAWRSIYNQVNAVDPTEDKVIREIRESVFKQTFRVTQNSELAGYASDDFGLIAKAFENKIDIEFINNLWDSYVKGSFPK